MGYNTTSNIFKDCYGDIVVDETNKDVYTLDGIYSTSGTEIRIYSRFIRFRFESSNINVSSSATYFDCDSFNDVVTPL